MKIINCAHIFIYEDMLLNTYEYTKREHGAPKLVKH